MFWKILCHSSLIVRKRQNACWYVKPIKNHTCWLPCSWCVYFKQQCASCGKTCACGSSTCLRMRGRVLYLNLHRAGSYWTFSTLNFYPHSKTFFTKGKKALQKPVLRGEKGGGAAASIWRIEQAISHQPCLIITNRSADDSVWNENHVGFPGQCIIQYIECVSSL